MKRNLTLMCLALVAACGGDDSGGGGGDDGKPTGQTGKKLTTAEQIELCETKLKAGFKQSELCDIGALGETSKETCEESRESCRKFSDPEAENTAADPGACKQLVDVTPDLFSGCTEDVNQIKACMKAVDEQIRKLIGDGTCDNLEEAQNVKTPSACAKLSDACYEVIRVM